MVVGDLYISPAKGEFNFELTGGASRKLRDQSLNLADIVKNTDLFYGSANKLLNNKLDPKVLLDLHKMSHLPEEARAGISEANKKLLKRIIAFVTAMSEFWVKQIKSSDFWKSLQNADVDFKSLTGQFTLLGKNLTIQSIPSGSSETKPSFALIYRGKRIAEFEIATQPGRERELASFKLCTDFDTYDGNPFVKLGLFFNEGKVINNQIVYEENRNRQPSATAPVLVA